jgi:hypothetical protein
MLAAALQGEVAAYVAQYADQLDDNGHRLVVRNGYHQKLRLLVMRGVRARLRSSVSGASARHNRSACSNRGHRRPQRPSRR